MVVWDVFVVNYLESVIVVLGFVLYVLLVGVGMVCIDVDFLEFVVVCGWWYIFFVV